MDHSEETAEPSVDRVPFAVSPWHVPPRRAGTQPPENAIDDGSVPFRAPATPSVRRLDWPQALQTTPFGFVKIAAAQACLQKAALNQAIRATSTNSSTLPRLAPDSFKSASLAE